MTRLEVLIREVAQFKTTRGGEARLLDDRSDVIAEWPRGCVDPPATREEAIEKALVLMRENGFDT